MAWVYVITTDRHPPWDYMSATDNANEIWNFFSAKGFTLASVAGILGNMDRESYINPGQKQSESTSSGWGLIQWTPSTALTDYVSGNWYDGALQIDLIDREGNNESPVNGRWLPTRKYPYTWSEFAQLTDVEEATRAFLAERERAGVEAVEDRIKYANYWYEYLSGVTPTPPDPPTPDPPTPVPIEHRKLPLYMMSRNIFIERK